MRAENLMSQPIVTCHVNDSLNIAAQLMWDHDCGVVAIVNDDGKLVGMVTDRDVCMAAYTQGRSLDAIIANSAMSTRVVSARPDQSLEDVEQMMASHKIRRIPVIDSDGRPIGIVSLNDLARESARSDTTIKQGAQKLARTLSAICMPRSAKRTAA